MSKMLSLVLRHYVKIALGAALLVSTGVHAGPSRGLSLATAEAPPAHETQRAPPDGPQSPAAVTPATQPQTTPTNPTSPDTTVARSSRHNLPVETRIINELHRHGIYW